MLNFDWLLFWNARVAVKKEYHFPQTLFANLEFQSQICGWFNNYRMYSKMLSEYDSLIGQRYLWLCPYKGHAIKPEEMQRDDN